MKNPYLGLIIPNMGVIRDSESGQSVVPGSEVADALFTHVQQRVLGLLFGNPDRSFYSNELVALAESGTGAVYRELKRLANAGLVTVTTIGRQKHYQANPESPVFEELRGLVLKTVGLADVLRRVLASKSDQITLAFVFGSVAKGSDTAASDIDLLIVSDDLTYAELFAELEDASQQLGRAVNPTVYSQSEFNQRRHDENPFLMRILAQPKIWIHGDDDELKA